MVRPFRRADAVRVLAGADTSGEADAPALIRAPARGFEEPAGLAALALGVRAGAQAYSHIRRDVLHPLGPDGVRPYAEFTGEAVIGPFALVSRPAAEPRITDDPEWPGRSDLELAWRMTEAYASAQFKYGSVFYGQMDRNWGPVGHRGHRLSDYGYNDAELGFEIGVDAVRLDALARSWRTRRQHRRAGSTAISSPTGSGSGSATGCGSASGRPPCSRASTASSTDATATRSACCCWPTSTAWAPTATCSSGSTGSIGSARAPRSRRRSASTTCSTRTPPARTAIPTAGRFTLAAHGPLGSRLGWRALYTQASSLAFRTLDPFENLTDGGVGLGRNFADMDRATVTVTVPVAPAGW